MALLTQLIMELSADDEMQVQENRARQVLDGQGRTRRRSGPDGQSAFTPVEQSCWARPRPGASRDVGFTETFETPGVRGERRWRGEVEVGEPTLLDTPAGRLRVLPMVGEGWYVQTGRDAPPLRGPMGRTVWYSPELGHPVAIDSLDRDADSRRLRKERIELMHAQTSRTVPQ